MANEQNLKPVKSKNEARERGKNGGKASGESRREKKAVREIAKIILDLQLKKGKKYSVDDIRNISDINGKNISVKEAAVFAQINKALDGDIKAFQLLLEIIGEAPGQAAANGQPESVDDALTVSLKEMAKELESDD